MYRNMKNRYVSRNHGVITVFVILIMVPVVVITGLMVDVARLKLFVSQAAMASDSYGEAVLSEYDNLLKDLYGLFSLTQNEEGIKALDEYAKYIGYSFHPNGDGRGLSGSMFYDSADISFDWKKIDGATLTNENVFMTQVADYMEFRVVQQVMDENGILRKDGIFDMLEQFEKVQDDNEAVAAMAKMGDSSNKALEEIDNYHSIIVDIKQYESYLGNLKGKASEYSKEMEQICGSGAYSDYVYYLENKEDIDKAKEWLANNSKTDENAEEYESKEELADKYVDVSAYRKEMEDRIKSKSEDAHKTNSTPVDFDNVSGKIDQLDTSANKIEAGIREVQEKLAVVEEKLTKCSEDVGKGIENDIKEMRELEDLSGEFKEVCHQETIQKNKENNTNNKTEMQNILSELDGVKTELLNGERKVNDTSWKKEPDFKWWNVPEGPNDLYTKLNQIYEKGTYAGEKKSDADEKKAEANSKRDEAVENLSNEEEKTEARKIPDDVLKELKSSSSTETVPTFLDYFNDGFSFEAIGEAGAVLLDKFLLTEYDFGMFSSRVTGMEKKSGGISLEKKGDEPNGSSYVECSLNKIPMTKDVNYLYGAEIEYLFGGHQDSKDNLAAARNTICGVRMTLNFISTYAIEEINTTINSISTAAAEAVAATGVGAVAAPLVKVAVSASLRMAVAAMETCKDWEHLKNREETLLFKADLEDLECVDDILGMLGKGSKEELKTATGTSVSTKRMAIKMSYEDYLHVLLFLCENNSTLVSRTSDLITLNVNQSQNQSDTLSAPLNFEMANTVTAVKTTCKAKLDMVVVPPNFMDLFLGGGDTQKRIEAYDDDYVYYTMIRGY